MPLMRHSRTGARAIPCGAVPSGCPATPPQVTLCAHRTAAARDATQCDTLTRARAAAAAEQAEPKARIVRTEQREPKDAGARPEFGRPWHPYARA